MTNETNTLKPHVTFKLTDREFEAMKIRLSNERERHTANLGRLYPFSQNQMSVLLHQPGGNSGCFEIMPCAIGDQHFVFLHGCFLHEGTICKMRFTTLHGAWIDRVGRVQNCRLVQNSIHEIIVYMEESVDVAEIVPSAVKRHVLLAEDDDLSAEIVKVHLSELNITMQHVTNGRLAVEKAFEKRFDLIILDLKMPEMDGITATKMLREKGYDGRVIILSAHTDAESQARALEAGCDLFLSKPFEAEKILEALNLSKGEPLISTLAGSPTFQPIINRWVSQLSERILAISKARKNCDREALNDVARELRSTAAACGFDPISQTALELESKIESSDTDELVSCAAAQLESLCRLARPVS